ncbi:MAG: hypothetical protein ACKON7_04925, partial [Planctomycetaceae bacterium]
MAALISAAVGIATAIVVSVLRRQTADDGPAAARAQRAGQQSIAKRHDAAVQNPPLVGTGPERQPDSDAEVLEQPGHLTPGHGIAAHALDPLRKVHRLLHLRFHIFRPRRRAPGIEFGQPCFGISKLRGEFAGSYSQLRPHGVIFFLQDEPRRLLYLPPEPCHFCRQFIADGLLGRSDLGNDRL